LTVEKSGFLEGTYKANQPEGEGSLLKVSSGEKLQDVVVRLFPAGSINGHVLDADGDPAPNGRVAIFTRPHTGNRSGNVFVDEVAANQAGEYRFDGLSPATYYVSANTGGSQSAIRQILVDSSGKATKVRDLKTFYPSALSVADAQAVRVESGQEQERASTFTSSAA
jgi:hypothetical protein